MTGLACVNRPSRACCLPGLLTLAWLSLGSCNRPERSEGERLARAYCAACHAFPEPQLLAKTTWQEGVLPHMAPRLGVGSQSLFEAVNRNPHMVVLTDSISQENWEKIVGYY